MRRPHPGTIEPTPAASASSDAALPRDLLARVRRIEIRTRRVVEDALAGRYHSAFKGRGMAFEEVRPYHPGDDVRLIDWNVSARTGEPHLKVHREERELTVLLLVDRSASLDFASAGPGKAEATTETAAVLALAATTNDDRIGLGLFTDRVDLWLPPRKGRRHVLRVIREVMAGRVEGRGTDLAAALDHVARVQRRRAVVFVLTDLLAGDWERSLQAAARRHEVIVVRVHDPRELELASAGVLPVVDLESGEERLVDTSSRTVRRAWRETAREVRLAQARAIAKAGAELVDVDASLPDVDHRVAAIERFLRTRSRRGRRAGAARPGGAAAAGPRGVTA